MSTANELDIEVEQKINSISLSYMCYSVYCFNYKKQAIDARRLQATKVVVVIVTREDDRVADIINTR